MLAIGPPRNILPAFAPIGKDGKRESPGGLWISMQSQNRYRRADIPANARSRGRAPSRVSVAMPQACDQQGCAESPVDPAANSRRSANAPACQTIAVNARCGSATAARHQPAVPATVRAEVELFPPSMARVDYAWLLQKLFHLQRSSAAQVSAAADRFSLG